MELPMLIRNPVAKNMHKSVRGSVITSKRRSLQSEATLRDAREYALNELECSQTMCFDGHSIDLWVLDEMSEVIHEENACLGCIGCSSMEIDCEED